MFAVGQRPDGGSHGLTDEVVMIEEHPHGLKI